jgi:hypothetical protein
MRNASIDVLVVGVVGIEAEHLLSWSLRSGLTVRLIDFKPPCEPATAAASHVIIIDGRREAVLALGECARLRVSAPKAPIFVLANQPILPFRRRFGVRGRPAISIVPVMPADSSASSKTVFASARPRVHFRMVAAAPLS